MEGFRLLKLTYRAERVPRELLQLLEKLPGGGRRFLTAPVSFDRGRHRLVLELRGARFELPIAGKALSWLGEREREVEPLKPARFALVGARRGRVELRLVLKVKRPRPARPDPRQALLVYVRTTEWGLAAVFASYDEGYAKIHEAAKRAPRAVWLQVKATGGAARAPEDYDARAWVRAAAAEIFKKARRHARGRSVLMNVDAPRAPAMSRLRRSLLTVGEVVENLANWYGIYAEYESHPSRECPLCGAELEEEAPEGRLVRVARCACGFTEDREYVPFHHWVRGLGLPPPRHPIRQLPGAGGGSRRA